jgi:ribosomal protein L32E
MHAVLLLSTHCPLPSPPLPQAATMVQPLVRRKKEVKKKKPFHRHQSDRKICVKPSWRRPKGIDGRQRR